MNKKNKEELYYNCFCKNIWKVSLGHSCLNCGRPSVSRPFYIKKPAKGVEEHVFQDGERVAIYDLDEMFHTHESFDDGTMLIGDFDEIMDKLGFE